ncbi:MAG: hydrolase [Candidatus Woesearchaeota archaeon]
MVEPIKIKNYDNSETGCCARWNVNKWDKKTFKWKNKLFVKDHVTSVFHIPLNFGKVVVRVFDKLNKADAFPKDHIWFNDENSLWGSDYYVAVTKEVPGADNVKLSGTFMTKTFEGPFKDMGKWTKDMEEYVKSKKKTVKKMYYCYTTCPKCAKTFGKNYVVLFAQV